MFTLIFVKVIYFQRESVDLSKDIGSDLFFTKLGTINMTNSASTQNNSSNPTILQYAPNAEGQYFIPVSVAVTTQQSYQTANNLLQENSAVPEETSRKRELRLLKNREAARECRRKKKEYVKCLENRVAVLENQNKALIEELKSLKEIYGEKEELV